MMDLPNDEELMKASKPMLIAIMKQHQELLTYYETERKTMQEKIWELEAKVEELSPDCTKCHHLLAKTCGGNNVCNGKNYYPEITELEDCP